VRRVFHKPELVRGRYQDALRGRLLDCVITDPPYSPVTMLGHNAGRDFVGDGNYRSEIGYGAWSEPDVEEFVQTVAPITVGWIVAFCDDELIGAWKRSFRAAGLYAFPAIPYVDVGSRVRRVGDGSSQWTCFIMTARPRHRAFSTWGTLRGAYILPPGQRDRNSFGVRGLTGHKPLWLMRELVRDYSRPNDLVADPCAGGAHTLIAASQLGRRSFGCDADPASYAVGAERVRLYNAGVRP